MDDEMYKFLFIISFATSISVASPTIADETTRAIQNSLNYFGYNAGVADGIWGPNTNQAVIEFFQGKGKEIPKENELILDGIVENTELSIFSIEALQYFDSHLQGSELLRVRLPDTNRILNDYGRYRSYRENRYRYNHAYVSKLWSGLGVSGEILNQERCFEILLNFEITSTPSQKEQDLVRCQSYYTRNAIVNFDDGIEKFGNLFLAMASAEEDRWIPRHGDGKDSNPSYYHLPGILAPFITFYAVNIDEFDLSDSQHETIQQFFIRKALIERFELDGDGRILNCPIYQPSELSESIHRVNNCGTVRLRFAAAELALAIVTQNEALWAKGLWDLEYTLSMIDTDGFFVPTSAKGCFALGYLWDTSKLFSMNVEILKVAGFDLLSYQTRHGSHVHEAYERLLQQYNDVTISNHIAEKGIGASGCGRSPYATHNEFLINAVGSIDHPQIPTESRVANWATQFISTYYPNLIERIGYNEIEADHFIGEGYFSITPFEIFNANISLLTESDRIISEDWSNEEMQEMSDWFRGAIRKSDLSIFSVLDLSTGASRSDIFGRNRYRVTLSVIDNRTGQLIFNDSVTLVEDANGLHKLTIDLGWLLESNASFQNAWIAVQNECNVLEVPDGDTIDVPIDFREYGFERIMDCLAAFSDDLGALEIYNVILFISNFLNENFNEVRVEESRGEVTFQNSLNIDQTRWFNEYFSGAVDLGLFLESYEITETVTIRNGDTKYRVWVEVQNDDGDTVFFGTLNFYRNDTGGISLGLEFDRLSWENPEFFRYLREAQRRCSANHEIDANVLDIPINYEDRSWQELVDCIFTRPMPLTVETQLYAWMRAAGSVEFK
ncbi:hypothetical protein LSUCC0031_12880 [Rhodobacterales bacterium LSUCC0031]|nr:hypothetical protein [Rhodobacterales bacterium LSUCC0031]